MTNYYAILETEDFASPETIKKAHRRLSMLYHPDRNHGNKDCEEKFKQVQNAYEHLSDPYKKYYTMNGSTRIIKPDRTLQITIIILQHRNSRNRYIL